MAQLYLLKMIPSTTDRYQDRIGQGIIGGLLDLGCGEVNPTIRATKPSIAAHCERV